MTHNVKTAKKRFKIIRCITNASWRYTYCTRNQHTIIPSHQSLPSRASSLLFAEALPPFVPPRSAEDDTAILIDSLFELGSTAAKHGVNVYLEPLNRYEGHMINTVKRAVGLIEAVRLPSVSVMLDLFHDNIEETDTPGVIEMYAEYIRHVHLAYTNRLQPAKGTWIIFPWLQLLIKSDLQATALWNAACRAKV